jgi:hypothetical protein
VGCRVTVINLQTNAVTVIGGTRIYTIAALWVMALVWDGVAWKNWIQDNEKPVGTYYTQYPATASNDYAAAFPASERPASLFGGTWSIVWDTEKVFFRTGGGQEAEDNRANGYQGDAIIAHRHKIKVYNLAGYDNGIPVSGTGGSLANTINPCDYPNVAYAREDRPHDPGGYTGRRNRHR